jgi:CDP-diacylglycerol--glycerol-3-phosphate 3-phosphatidyltransferase
MFGSVLLLFFPAFSAEFYIIYILCGLSDMIDGTVARKTNSADTLGAKLDTAADLVFVAVSLIKMLPTLHIPRWSWFWGGAIAMVRLGNIIWGYACEKQFISLHTFMNKITGLLLFLLPFTLPFVELKYSAAAVCSIATLAAMQEGVYLAAQHKNR